MELTTENVDLIFRDCLYNEGENTDDHVAVECVTNNFGFHPGRLESHKEEIGKLLSELPDEFHDTKGGGMSFLNACVTRHDQHWGEHRSIEQLLALGIGTKQARILLPRSMWSVLPGGMPYFSVSPVGQQAKTEKERANES